MAVCRDSCRICVGCVKMAELKFSYGMEINFSNPVEAHHFTLRCVPSSRGCQKISELRTEIFPVGEIGRVADSFGNICLYGSRLFPHDLFSVHVEGIATTGLERECVREDRFLSLYRMPTKLVCTGPFIHAIHAGIPKFSGNRDSWHERALLIMDAVRRALIYEKGSTTSATSAESAAASGHGVCQDFAHLMLALLRQDSIACRYVCGLMQGEGESHAWVEVPVCGRWHGFDPTNGCETGEDYAVISVGRDASDCAINRGIYRNEAGQRIRICASLAGVNKDQ